MGFRISDYKAWGGGGIGGSEMLQHRKGPRKNRVVNSRIANHQAEPGAIPTISEASNFALSKERRHYLYVESISKYWRWTSWCIRIPLYKQANRSII